MWWAAGFFWGKTCVIFATGATLIGLFTQNNTGLLIRARALLTNWHFLHHSNPRERRDNRRLFFAQPIFPFYAIWPICRGKPLQIMLWFSDSILLHWWYQLCRSFGCTFFPFTQASDKCDTYFLRSRCGRERSPFSRLLYRRAHYALKECGSRKSFLLHGGAPFFLVFTFQMTLFRACLQMHRGLCALTFVSCILSFARFRLLVRGQGVKKRVQFRGFFSSNKILILHIVYVSR